VIEETAPLSWVLGAAGPPVVIEHKGLRWQIGHPTQSARAVLEQYLAAQAIGEVEELRDVLPPQQYASAKKEVLSLVTGKWFKTGGKGWVTAIEGPDGVLLFIFALLRVHQPACAIDDAKMLMADRLDELTVALEQVAPDFFMALTDPSSPDAERERNAKTMFTGFIRGLRTVSASRAKTPGK